MLFGSVARGDFDGESDVDVFIDAVSAEGEAYVGEHVRAVLERFEASSETTWHLRGIDLPIRPMVGRLDDERWSGLLEEIKGHGIVLYGPFQKLPENLERKVILNYSLAGLSQRDKMRVIRRLRSPPPMRRRDGGPVPGDERSTVLAGRSLLVDPERAGELAALLRKHGARYQVREVYIRQS